MPTKPQIIPYIFYRDVPAALDWLAKTFGFKEKCAPARRKAACSRCRLEASSS